MLAEAAGQGKRFQFRGHSFFASRTDLKSINNSFSPLSNHFYYCLPLLATYCDRVTVTVLSARSKIWIALKTVKIARFVKLPCPLGKNQ